MAGGDGRGRLTERGRAGAPLAGPLNLAGLTEYQIKAAYNAGQLDAMDEAERAGTEIQGPETQGTQTEEDYPFYFGSEEGVSHEEGSIRLREGGQRADGEGAGVAVEQVEGRPGGDPAGADRAGPADAGAGALQVGRAISSSELGIADGVTTDSVRVVTGGETEAVRAARAEAEQYGMELVLFTGGNLHVQTETDQGERVTVEARGYIKGNKVYVRADHAEHTAYQLWRHELYHALVREGQVSPEETMRAVERELGPELTDRLAAVYSTALGGLEGVDLWEEIAADQHGGMNIFAGTTWEGEMEALGLLVGTQTDAQKANSQTAQATDRQTGPPQEGRYSREGEKDGFIGEGLQKPGTGSIIEDKIGGQLSDEEEWALLSYKSSGSYKLNAALMDGRPLDQNQDRMMRALDRALEKLPIYRGKVYRRIDFNMQGPEALEKFLAEHRPGNSVRYPAYTSASTSEDGYKIEGKGRVTLVIQSESGRDLAGYGNNQEQEIVFPRQSTFVVERVDTDRDGSPIIYMKEEQKNGSGQLNSEEYHGKVSQVQKAQGGIHLRGVSDLDPERSDRRGVPGLRGEGDGRGSLTERGSGGEEFSREPSDYIRELRELRTSIKEQKARAEYWYKQAHLTRTEDGQTYIKVNQTDTHDQAAKLKDMVGTRMTIREIEAGLGEVYDMMASGRDGGSELTYEGLREKAERLAREMVVQAVEVDDSIREQTERKGTRRETKTGKRYISLN